MPAINLIASAETSRVSPEFVVDATTGPALLIGRRGSAAGPQQGWRCEIEAKVADGTFVRIDKLDQTSPTGLLVAFATYRLSSSVHCVVDRG